MRLPTVRKQGNGVTYELLHWDDRAALVFTKKKHRGLFPTWTLDVHIHRLLHWPNLADAIALLTLLFEQSVRRPP